MPPSSGSSQLKIFLLGPFRVEVNDKAIDERQWPRRKAKLLVKLLALQPHHQLHREQIMDLLWPELEPEAAANNLNKIIYQARRALEPKLKSGAASCFIVAQKQMVSLTAQDLWVDVQEFERLARTACARQQPDDYAQALALYGGDLLIEDPYEDWATGRREALRALQHELLAGQARLAEARAQCAQSIQCWQALVAAEPTHEEAHRELMRLYALTGNRHQALSQYRHCAEVLRKELDAAPDAETSRLYEQISTGQLKPRTKAPPPVPVATNTAETEHVPTPPTTTSAQATGFVPTDIADIPAIMATDMPALRTIDRPRPRSLHVYLSGLFLLASIVLFFSGVRLYASGQSQQIAAEQNRRARADSLAVIPFTNETHDASLDFLSDGLSESVVNNLAHVAGLRVLARSTVLRYRGKEVEPRQAGRELNVGTVLTGRMQRQDETLIVQVELINTEDGARLWGQQYQSQLADTARLRQELAQEVAEHLRLRFDRNYTRPAH